MHLRRVEIENFKGVRQLQMDLSSPAGGPRPLTALLGENGSGKTTVLQAIALVLSLATRRIAEPGKLNWSGFLAERVGTLGPTSVRLEVGFSANEIALTGTLREEWLRTFPHSPVDWGVGLQDQDHTVELTYRAGELHAKPAHGIAKFWGRYFAEGLARVQPERKHLLRQLGGVFCFDQNRNLSTVVSARDEAADGLDRSWLQGVGELREFLIGAWGYHTSVSKGNGKDYIAELERHLGALFPRTRILGIEPRANVAAPRPRDFYFLLERDGRRYDIAEMSSGEQAIFPLLLDFLRLDIGNSIVLIDELELHLHPPQQQALLTALRKIGPDCQFIITTHSPYLADVLPQEEKVRLPGGSLCL
ncbi:MAG: AAA family ATPase [Planctomycetes bacterium]|nr:AAA family ATPase [Planctomycetota bacterium]